MKVTHEKTPMFKRMVVGLPQSLPNYGACNVAADLAERLNIQFLAAFIADASVRALVDSPAARELRLPERNWQTIDRSRMLEDLESAATIARRRVTESTQGRSLDARFDIIEDVDAIGPFIQADDLVVVIDPAHPGERITRQFTCLLDAAVRTAAAVLVLPAHVGRTAGPVVAFATGSQDPSLRIGLQVASALQERLIVEVAEGLPLSSDMLLDAQRLGVRVEQLPAMPRTPHASAMALSSDRLNERLRVLTRSRTLDEITRLFWTARGIPLMIIHPDRVEVPRDQ
jgi:hypothetical protein